MSVTISEVRKGAQGKTEWHIKNWAADFFVLQEHASCKLIIEEMGLSPSPPAHLRFYFKPFEEKNSTGLVTSSWLSLNTELLSGGYVPMIILVDVVGAENMKNPMEIKNTRCTLRKGDSKCLAMTTIREKFIHLERYSYTPMGQLASTDRFSKDTDLLFNIAVTILNVNEHIILAETKSSFESNVGATSTSSNLPGAEMSLSRDLTLMYGADENFSDLKLETKDNMALSCHRFILAARSPVFRSMIEKEQTKRDKEEGTSSKTMTLQMSTVNAKPLIAVLHWMYSGELRENVVKVMEEVVEICIAFKISALLNILDNKLITVCSTQNMFQLFQVAQQNGMKNAMDAISQFIKENISTVVPATQK